MIRRILDSLVGVVFAFATGPALADTLLTNVTLVDIERGSLSEPQSVMIREGVITGIGPDIESQGADIVEADEAYLIPGLWDSHVHIFSTQTEPDTALPLYLINGVTGIRDMGALWPLDAQRSLQARIASGEVLGPRLILSGAWVDGRPGSWPGMFLADTPAEARAVVDRIASEGWAAVKAYSMLTESTYRALAQAASETGLPLVGHIPEAVALETALDAGQDGMEHFGRVTQACATREGELVQGIATALAEKEDLQSILTRMASHNAIVLQSWERAHCETVLSRIAAADLHVSPTLVVANFYTGNWPAADAPRMRMLPAEVRGTWDRPDFRLQAMTDELRALAADSIALGHRTFWMAHDAGVPILASSDASFANPYLFHGFSLLDELDIYVAAGLSPREALFTATVAPPRFFDLADQDGTIAVGRRADLVLLEKNPLQGLATLRSPLAVIVAGKVLDRAALDTMRSRLLRDGQ